MPATIPLYTNIARAFYAMADQLSFGWPGGTATHIRGTECTHILLLHTRRLTETQAANKGGALVHHMATHSTWDATMFGQAPCLCPLIGTIVLLHPSPKSQLKVTV